MRQNRGSPIAERCERCFAQRRHCFCDQIPTLNPKIKITVIRHWKERFKPSNTARLAAHAIASLDLIDFGAPGSPWQNPTLTASGTALLFPDPDAPAAHAPEHIIVVDGSWAQARKMVNKIAGLKELPRFNIQPPETGLVRIRTPPEPGMVSTLEAIAAVLDITEGAGAGEPLRRLYETTVKATIAARGRPLHT
jgi:DTW domain-containing protein YfiP